MSSVDSKQCSILACVVLAATFSCSAEAEPAQVQDRAATTVEGLGLCGEIAPPDCRSEGISKDAPESYVWWPTRNFLTPDAEAIAPPGSRAAHVGAGFAVAAPLLE